jgi:hypothetical protein
MEHIRTLSKRLFGALYRLEISAALASGDVVTLTTFAASLSSPPSLSSVAKELQVLESVGLLERQPTIGGMRSVYLRAVESPYWDTCRHLCTTTSKSALRKPTHSL